MYNYHIMSDGKKYTALAHTLIVAMEVLQRLAPFASNPTRFSASRLQVEVRCACCDTAYNWDGWCKLERIGVQHYETADFEQRNCPCKSTLSLCRWEIVE